MSDSNPIETAVLARLVVRTKKPPTESEVVKSVGALFSKDASDRIRAELGRLEANGLRQAGAMLLTEKGMSRALEVLELDARAMPTRWNAVKARLAELAVGHRPSAKPMTASALRASALSAKLGLSPETLRPADVLDAWAARQLGMPGQKLTLANVRAHALAGAIGLDSLRDPKRIGVIATAKVLGVARVDAASVRASVLRDWLEPNASKPITAVKDAAPRGGAPADLDGFATTVKALARTSTEGRFGRHKVFIGSVWSRAREEPRLRSFSEAEFKERLIAAHRAGLLRLSRADLTPAMSHELVVASEVPYLNAVFHFVDLEGALS